MTRRRVLKLGGSLLTHPGLAAAIEEWLAAQPPAQDLVIVGGGQMIEAMRGLSQRFALDEPAMHWRCIRLLRATYEVAGELFRHWQPISDANSLQTLAADPPQRGQWLVAVDTFYSPTTAEAAGLPIGWETTTDAIAAYLASRTAADELVLLKSCPVPEQASLDQLTAAGIVDARWPLPSTPPCPAASGSVSSNSVSSNSARKCPRAATAQRERIWQRSRISSAVFW